MAGFGAAVKVQWKETSTRPELRPSAADLLCGRAPGQPRHFLFVCGPFGSFTRSLAAELRRLGAQCSRVLLNGGDVLDWGPRHGRLFRGRAVDWSAWLDDLISRDAITDLIIYGDSHPYCAAAKKVALARGLAVHVLEQGYFRPFWITLERNGVNAHSELPRDPRRIAARRSNRRRTQSGCRR